MEEKLKYSSSVLSDKHNVAKKIPSVVRSTDGNNMIII